PRPRGVGWRRQDQRRAVVGVPANASRPLVEAIKHSGTTPRFLPLTASLQLAADASAEASPHVVWAQPVGGLVMPAALPDVRCG
ncbi:MAG: hypothetical protein HC893_13855, partial [Chloroflexaceae bacterium]|nr:hypothetical protein [Chloroflexaceae bacterium]